MKPSFPDSLISHPSYNLARKDKTTVNKVKKQKQGGGVCLYIKAGISLEVIILIDDERLNCDIELICVKVGIGGNKKQ